MDWKTIAQQNDELSAAVEALSKVFEQAKLAIKTKQDRILAMIAQSQSQEAAQLQQIHEALAKLLKSSDLS
jgi:ABC-type transporter Mla subunit MlaD